MRVAARVAWLVLVSVFAVSAAGKAADPAGFAFRIEAFGVSAFWAWPFALATIFAELAIALGLLFRRSRGPAAAAAGLLLLTFAAVLTWTIAEGKAGTDCACFGALVSGKVSPLHVAANIILALLAFAITRPKWLSATPRAELIDV
jgi:hypothetical protein